MFDVADVHLPTTKEEAFVCVVYIYSTFALSLAFYLLCDQRKKQSKSTNNSFRTTQQQKQKQKQQWYDIDQIPPATSKEHQQQVCTPTHHRHRPSNATISPWIANSPSSSIVNNNKNNNRFISPASTFHPPPKQLAPTSPSLPPTTSLPPFSQHRYNKPLHEIHPHFPTLRLREVLSNTILHPNSRAPIPFRTEHFQGHILVMLKTKPQDPFYTSHFRTRKRMMEIHVQGHFLLTNLCNTTADKDNSEKGIEETLFIGGEIKGSMKLGTFARGVASLMLKMVKSLSYGMFGHSFGGDKEVPHIVTSLYQGVDHFVVTDPTKEKPPKLGEDLPESAVDRKRRRTSTTNFQIDPAMLYTFSYHTMYIDLLQWQVVKIPGFRPISLEGYWGRQPFYIPCYKMNMKGKYLENGGMHETEEKKYYWSIEIDRIWDKAAMDGNPTAWPEVEEVRDVKDVKDVKEGGVEEEEREKRHVLKIEKKKLKKRKIQITLTYEKHGQINFILFITEKDQNQTIEREKTCTISLTRLTLSCQQICQQTQNMKDGNMNTNDIDRTNASTTTVEQLMQRIVKCCVAATKLRPRNVVQLSTNTEQLEICLNRVLNTQRPQLNRGRVNATKRMPITTTTTTSTFSTTSNQLFQAIQRNPYDLFATVLNSNSRSGNGSMQLSPTTMFSSSTLCCANQQDTSIPNYWRYGWMELEKNLTTSLVTLSVSCSKTRMPILVVPVSSITKCYCGSTISGRVVRSSGNSGRCSSDVLEDVIGSKLQLCTTSSSHGVQLFTFVVENENLCEEWIEIIKTKACL